jgi:hypothetical protein
MTDPSTPTQTPPRRLLVLANEACSGTDLLDRIRELAGAGPTDVLIVAPALSSRLHYWASDEDEGIAAAGRRLAASIERCAAAGISARGAVGDADPLLALDDAMRTFAPHEVVIATHPEQRSNWLEHGLLVQARERFDVPITHFVVDSVDEPAAHLVEREPVDPKAPPRERHTRRDLGLLVVAWLLAILGSVGSAILVLADAPEPVLWTWVLVFDLGLKVAAGVILWVLFQRRPRADRLDF